jgi:integrase
LAWLDEYAHKKTTWRSYKKESERFLVWCALVRHTSLAAFDRDDVEAYVNFLKDPQPREKWCGPRGGRKTKDNQKLWYPFTGPLSGTALQAALTILNSLMSYLVDARYIETNAFALLRRKSRFHNSLEEQKARLFERILDNEESEALISTMNNAPEDNLIDRQKKARLIFLVNILFFLGLRIHELALATWQNFRKVNNKWWFFTKGKGDRYGKIPVNSELLLAFMRYRQSMGLQPLPTGEDEGPIFTSIHNKTKSLSARQMSNLLKELARKTADNFPGDQIRQDKFSKFSPHWLRHLSASRQDLAGISFTHIKENMRHKSEATTRAYVHAFDDNRHQEMERLSLIKNS